MAYKSGSYRRGGGKEEECIFIREGEVSRCSADCKSRCPARVSNNPDENNAVVCIQRQMQDAGKQFEEYNPYLESQSNSSSLLEQMIIE